MIRGRFWKLAALTLATTLTLCMGSALAQPARIVEYTDNDYKFAFQYPSDWKMQKLPPRGEAGETRASLRAPGMGGVVMALVGTVGNSITKKQFETSPNRQAAIDTILELMTEAHKQVAREVGASGVVVDERRYLPSDVGLKFYITSGHVRQSLTVALATMHIVPFGKDYVVIFALAVPAGNRMTPAEKETAARVFDSFHVRGERPVR